MPLRLPCLPVPLHQGHLRPGWVGAVLFRPLIDVWLIGPNRRVERAQAQLDTAADYSLFRAALAPRLGVSLPAARRLALSGAAGTQTATVSFPPDGQVSLFLTDYTEYYYLPSPLISFHPPGPTVAAQRSVLGLTGFLQHFRFVLDHGPTPPAFELHPLPAFPGATGALPRDRPLIDFLHSLRGP